MKRTVRILGTHGVPAAYGGFETAAEQIGLYLVQRGWRVIVYCQVDGRGETTVDEWRGIERVQIPQHRQGWLGTSAFDWATIRDAIKHDDICLTFGYNTGVFNILQRIKHIPNVINMDGMEWTRTRWGLTKQGILLANERIAIHVGNHLIADHPEIERYLRKQAPARKISMITYGAHAVVDAPTSAVTALGLEPGRYLTVICRPIPENSILEIVDAYSRSHRGYQLVVLGSFIAGDSYHREVRSIASDEVTFPGPIYAPNEVQALRFHSRAYIHGHTVGGTNPSLVEAMAAGNPVIAHDNVYNRWVAGADQRYFTSVDHLDSIFDQTLHSPEALGEMGDSSRRRHAEEFTWEHVAGQYEELLSRYLADQQPSSPPAGNVTMSAQEEDL
jgi:glycosyltransferase involved in cell wall biosynthesis